VGGIAKRVPNPMRSNYAFFILLGRGAPLPLAQKIKVTSRITRNPPFRIRDATQQLRDGFAAFVACPSFCRRPLAVVFFVHQPSSMWY
jgi:hypothetical protein